MEIAVFLIVQQFSMKDFSQFFLSHIISTDSVELTKPVEANGVMKYGVLKTNISIYDLIFRRLYSFKESLKDSSSLLPPQCHLLAGVWWFASLSNP